MIVSPSNSRSEISEKRALYFDAGAAEVWICALDGSFSFFVPPHDHLPASSISPAFPDRPSRDSRGSEPFQYELAAGPAALDQRMGLFKIGGIDCSERLRSRGADHTAVDKIRNFLQ